MLRNCIDCDQPFEGRSDKIFCSNYCKSNHHYEKRKRDKKSFYNRVNDQLSLNRRLLKHFNTAGKSTIRSEDLISAGFNSNIFTHTYRTKSGNEYFFCYDVGFQLIRHNGRSKYSLVHWQENYMSIPNLGD
ncbi:MAG: hypothetical protein ACI828_002936 [Flavobacteriales bacterium]|jgi:hypothetical protein